MAKGNETGKSSEIVLRSPNFLIIGAAKSGTTALWQYLRQHPEIFMSERKHVRHFSFLEENPSFDGPPPKNVNVPYAVIGDADYLALFDGAEDATALGEASHSYLYQSIAAERIKSFSPEMKHIAVLRDPTGRAFSHYRQMIRDGREEIHDFEAALSAEESRIDKGYWPDFHYASISQYSHQVSRYFELFGREQIRIYLYEDLLSQPEVVLQEIFRFLEVDETFSPGVSVRYNASGLPKNVVLHQVLQGARRLRPLLARHLSEERYRSLLQAGSRLHNGNLAHQRLEKEVRRRVTDKYFREDVIALEALIGRDLSPWIE